MRRALLIPLFAFLASCGVAGEPSHPEEKNTFTGSLSLGTSTAF